MATIFKVARTHPEVNDMTRLVKAENAKAVRAHLLKEFEITEADAEDAHKLGELGVKIETATE